MSAAGWPHVASHLLRLDFLSLKRKYQPPLKCFWELHSTSSTVLSHARNSVTRLNEWVLSAWKLPLMLWVGPWRKCTCCSASPGSSDWPTVLTLLHQTQFFVISSHSSWLRDPACCRRSVPLTAHRQGLYGTSQGAFLTLFSPVHTLWPLSLHSLPYTLYFLLILRIQLMPPPLMFLL